MMYEFKITGYASSTKDSDLYNSSKPVEITVLADNVPEAITKAEKVLGDYISTAYRRVVIKELQDDKRVEELEYILAGVMHSVDKWLEGDEFDQDEVNRAATMREKVLQIVEARDAHIRLLEKDLKELTREREILCGRIDELERYIIGCPTKYEKNRANFAKICDYITKGHLPPLKEE